MYDVYIKNYKSGNSIVTTETKIFGVPLNNDTIGFPVSRPNVKCSEDNADSFDFSMENTSPYYDAFLELKTLLRVEYDGDTIFDGRVLTIDGSTIYQTKTVHCEGSFGYMNDSQYEGIQEKRKSKITWSEYYNRLINNHNTMVGTDNPEKVITRGTVTIDGSTTFTPTTETRQYEPSSWTKTSSLISSLVSEFGGHIRTRYQNGTRYLDWYKYYARDLGVNRPTVEVGVNIVDLSTSDSNIDNLFTYCIPIGASNSNGEPVYVDGYVYTDKNGNQHTHSGKAVPVSIIRDLYTDSQLNDDFHNASDYSSAKANYGSIYRPENFGGAKTKEQLWNFMKEWIKNCYFGLATSFTVRGYDIHITDPAKSKILVGDCVNVKYYIVENGVKTFVTKRLVCKAVTYDLFNPENNSYTFGIPGEILKRTYSEGRKSASEQLTGGGGGGGGGDGNQYELTFLDIARKIQAAAGESDVYGGNAAMDSFLANGPCFGTVSLYDPAELPSDEDPPNPRAHPELAFQANIVGKLTHSGATKWIAVSDRMLCAFMNVRPDRDEAQPVAFIYERYSKSNKYPGYTAQEPIQVANDGIEVLKNLGLKLYNDGGLKVVVQKTTGLFDTVVNLGANLVDGLSGFLGLKGPTSGLNVSTDGDNDNSKKIVIDAATAAINLGSVIAGSLASKLFLDGLNGKAKVGKKQNNAWEVLLNETITYEDDQGVIHTEPGFVVCNDINIPSIPSFKTKLAIVDTLIANSATIGQLNAANARIATLEADAITARNLRASIANIPNLAAQNISANNVQINVGGIYGDLSNSIMNLRLVEVTGGYQIWGAKFNGDIVKTETFNSATQLSGSWSGNTYTVRATPQGDEISTQTFVSMPTWGTDDDKGKATVSFYYFQDGERVEILPATINCNAKLQEKGPGSTKIISNGTYYPTDDKIGFKYVVVDVAGGGDYDAGWAAAVAKIAWPSSGTSNSYIEIAYPPSEVDGDSLNRVYAILNDGNNAVKLSSNGTTYARFEHGKYSAGYTAGWEVAVAKIVWPSSGTSNSYIEIAYPPSEVDGDSLNRVYAILNDGNNAVKLSSNGTAYARFEHGKYDAGWAAARGKITWPGAGTSGSMNIKYPPSTVDGSASTKTYSITNDGNNAVKLNDTSDGTVVAKFTHNKYDAGWASARGKIAWPSAGITGSMNIKYPPSTVDGSASTKTYSITNDGDNAVKLNDTSDGTVVAKFTHNKYSAGVTEGKNACGLSISTNDAKIKLNKSSNTVTEVSIVLNLGSVNAQGKRTVKVTANTTDLLSNVIQDYKNAWELAQGLVTLPAEGSKATFIFKYPSATIGETNAVSTTYTIANDGNNAVKVYSGGVTVGKITHGKYDAGWKAARDKITWPGAGTTGSMNIKYPPSTVDGSASTKTYSITNDGNNAVKLNDTSDGTVVAKFTHNKYSAGYDAGNAAGYSSGVTDGKNAVGLTISTSDTKIKRNQSSNTLTEVKISQDLGSVGSDKKRTIKVKANTTVLLTNVITDYLDGYNAGLTAGKSNFVDWLSTASNRGVWFDYTTERGSNYASSLAPSYPESGKRRYIYAFFNESSSGPSHTIKANTWYVPEPWLFTASGEGTYHQGDLTAGSYICIGARGYANDGSYANWANPAYTWKVPSGSSPAYSVVIKGKGNDATSASGGVFTGYTTHYVSSMPARRNQAYQYILFTVDGKKHAFYW